MSLQERNRSSQTLQVLNRGITLIKARCSPRHHINFPVLLHLLHSSPEQSCHCQPYALVHSTLNLLLQPHGNDDCPSQFENHHLQIQEAGLGVSQKKSRLREGNAARMRKAGMTEQGWSLRRPCTPEEKGSGTCNSSTVAVSRKPEPSGPCMLLLELLLELQLSHHDMYTRWKQHQNVRQARMSLYTTSSFNFRKFQTDPFQLMLSGGQKDWLKEFKKSTNLKFTWSMFPLQWTTYIPLS